MSGKFFGRLIPTGCKVCDPQNESNLKKKLKKNKILRLSYSMTFNFIYL